ncbi:hypothetical protein [Novosphingobium sp. TH158]|uniref:hypothetical protein n=1 Tax=Novosphingobium sp. TH158 TaxID=2067455 RepID=UPI000C7AB97F|nr:hypothetical protein [Novosphingobium sp. TH158]PLK27633.1 hypothetical protein C0V78_12620 [Novosphingobium sp. TH158]
MIDQAAPSLLPLGGAMPEMRAGPAVASEETGGFAGLLALEIESPVAAVPQSGVGGSMALAASSPPPTLSVLPASGNTLPVVLPPVAAASADSPVAGKAAPSAAISTRLEVSLGEVDAASGSEPVAGQMPSSPAPVIALARPMRAARAAAHAEESGRPSETAEPVVTDEEPADAADPAAGTLPVVSAQPALPPLAPAPVQVRTRRGEAERAPVALHQPVPAAPAQPAKPETGPQQPAPLPAAILSARMALEPAEAVQVSEPAAAASAARPEQRTAAPAPAQQPSVSVNLAPAAFQPAPEAAPVPAANRSETPVDFAQLVDRLVAAREAVAPAAVKVSLDHAQFGKVSLSFAPDASGLNVTLASPDPEFARAVEAAALVPPASAGAETTGSSSGQPSRQGDSGFSFTSGQGQSSARQNAGADQRGTAARNDRAAPSDQPPAERRRGIFA